MFIPAEDIVVPFGASDLRSAPRITHIMRKTENEVRKLQHAGFYRDVDLGEPSTTLSLCWVSRENRKGGFVLPQRRRGRREVLWFSCLLSAICCAKRAGFPRRRGGGGGGAGGAFGDGAEPVGKRSLNGTFWRR